MTQRDSGPTAITSQEPAAPWPRFSVIVCTRDRERFLEATIVSVLEQDYPAHGCEVIVIDNDSRDGTRAVVERLGSAASVPVAYHLEKRAGTSHARNLGLEQARYPHVAYLDDDTIAPPGWLRAYARAIAEHGALAAGGPVIPVLEPGTRQPVWWSRRQIRDIFGVQHDLPDSATHAIAIRWPLWLGGCNVIYSRTLLLEHGGFRTECGPVGPHYRVAEDIDLNARLERAGVPVFYVPAASVTHRITADRLRRRYLWRRAYSAGLTDVAAASILERATRQMSWPQLARSALDTLLCREPARTAAGCRLAYGIGRRRRGAVNPAPGDPPAIRVTR